MKVLIAVIMMLALITTSGCWNTQSSNKGGIAPVNEEFSITVPENTTIKQGETATITITLNRDAYFKQNVHIKLKAEGITIMPVSVVVNASDSPDVKIKIMAVKDAAIGQYSVTVTGIPSVGRTATTTFAVNVVSK